MKRVLAVLAMAAMAAGCVTTATDQLDRSWASDILGWATDWAGTLSDEEVADLWEQAEELRDILDGKIPLPVPDPVTTNAPGTAHDQRAGFLLDGAGTRAMNALHLAVTPDEVDAMVARLKSNGDDTAWLYAHNERDGAPSPTTIYADGVYGNDPVPLRVEHAQRVLRRFRDAGLRVVLWLTSDDGGAQVKADRAAHLKHVENCISAFDGLTDEYCVGLEMNEDARGGHAQAMVAHAKTLTAKRVGVHLTTGRWQEAVTWGADVLYYQYGFGKSAEVCQRETIDVIRNLDGRAAFIAAEYHKSSDSAEARAIGAAIAAVPGVVGTGNGREYTSPPADEWSSIDWVGVNLSACTTVDGALSVTDLTSRGVTLHYEGLTWPNAGLSGCNAICCIFERRGDTWRGGKWEWARVRNPTDSEPRGLGNVHDGYGGLDPAMLRSGNRVAFCMVNPKNGKRTPIVEAVMP